MRIVRVSLLSLLLLAFTLPAFASATVEQHTTMKFGGMIGRMANMFGGKTAKDGIDSITVVKGDRRINRNADTAEIVDLGEEKIYALNAKNRTYTVMTFAELRKQFEDMQKQMKEAGEQPSGRKDGPELVTDVDVKETGAKQSINGFDAKQVVVTVTTHEKGKTIEESGGGVLTADLWLGPKVAALDEVSSFERKYLQAIWGDSFDVRSFAALATMAPGFADAMKKFQQKSDSLSGTPIRSTVTYETVAGAAGAPEEESGSSMDPAAGAAKMIGGFLAKRAKKTESSESASGETKGAANRSMLFTSTTELRKAALTADDAELAIPADYKLKK